MGLLVARSPRRPLVSDLEGAGSARWQFMERRTFITNLITGALAVGAASRPIRAQERRYLTEERALRLALPSSAKVAREERELTDEQLHAVEKTLGTRLQSRTQVIYRGETQGATDGYAMIMHEIGKEQLITFVVSLTKEFKVQRVALMVFRESRGWEVEDARFTGQFRGKTSHDRFLVGADIIGITGATLSARAFGRGTKKALAICEALYKH